MKTATKPSGPKAKPQVGVLYNGATKEFRYKPNERVDHLLEAAIAAFAISANQHLLSLFSPAGAELSDTAKLEAAGVHAGEVLVLRPGVVKGG